MPKSATRIVWEEAIPIEVEEYGPMAHQRQDARQGAQDGGGEPTSNDGASLDEAFAAVLAECPADFRESLDRRFAQADETRIYRAEIVRQYWGLAPLSPIEWGQVRDMAAMEVEIARNARMITDLVNLGRAPALRRLLRPAPALKAMSDADFDRLIHDYLGGDPAAVAFVEERLREIGHAPSILGAMSRAQQSETIEVIERSLNAVRKASFRMLDDLLRARRAMGSGSGGGKAARASAASPVADAVPQRRRT